MLRLAGVGSLIIFIILIFPILPVHNNLDAYHSPEELRLIFDMIEMHGADTSAFFATSGLCENCHSEDEHGVAMIDSTGKDVSMFNSWRATMMANAARDPFWRAKVSHETLINPQHAQALETKCTSCHAPLGNYKARLLGADHYSIAEMVNDTFGMDGVSCGSCHHMGSENLGNTFSGEINYDTNRVAFGPHLFPFEQSMLNFIGFTPTYSLHTLDAGICAPCHTLITETADLEGNLTGTTFVEQATYHEWLNSRYNTEDISCQACHMPVLEESVIIAANAPNLVGRSPYGLHELVGANTYMLELMKNNRDTLGIPAGEENFDATIAATFKMLQEKSINTALSFLETIGDTAVFKFRIENKAGHKFPSGYPSRRAFVEFILSDQDGTDFFHSGKLDNEYAVLDQDDPYEPHYDIINDEEQVQIYEFVNGDVTGNFSTILERGFEPLKDNRLTPQGFSKSHISYDTTMIVGNANQDPNFNYDNNVEGSGADEITYKIALNGYFGLVNATAKVHYQSLPPHWMKEMFDENTPEIDLFRGMYEAADPIPALVSTDELNGVFVGTSSVAQQIPEREYQLHPVPSEGRVFIAGKISDLRSIKIFDFSGKLIIEKNRDFDSLLLPETPGIYYLQFRLNSGYHFTKKVIKI